MEGQRARLLPTYLCFKLDTKGDELSIKASRYQPDSTCCQEGAAPSQRRLKKSGLGRFQRLQKALRQNTRRRLEYFFRTRPPNCACSPPTSPIQPLLDATPHYRLFRKACPPKAEREECRAIDEKAEGTAARRKRRRIGRRRRTNQYKEAEERSNASAFKRLVSRDRARRQRMPGAYYYSKKIDFRRRQSPKINAQRERRQGSEKAERIHQSHQS